MVHRNEQFEFNVIGFFYSVMPTLAISISREKDMSAGEHEPLKIVPIMPAIRILTEHLSRILHLLTILGLMSELKNSNV